MCFLVFREVLSLHAPELALHCTAKFPFFVISVVHIKLTWQLDGSISLWQSNINIHWSRKCVALPRISQLRNSPFRSHFYPSLISFSLSSAVADDWFFAKVILKLMWNFFFTSGCCWKKTVTCCFSINMERWTVANGPIEDFNHSQLVRYWISQRYGRFFMDDQDLNPAWKHKLIDLNTLPSL